MYEGNLLICESSGRVVSHEKQSDGSILMEGIFAEFGVENNNRRIYEEAEYMPHLNNLQRIIKESKLVGELDHPENFDINYTRASHIIESLVYDQSTRTVRGKIRILPTTNGTNVRVLLEAGVPLSISSRAAGKVNENKTVSISALITYDIVANPGFEKARLNQVYESINFNPKKESKLVLMNEKYGIDSPYLSIYSLKEDNKISGGYIKEDKQNNDKSMNNEFLSKHEFSMYSKHLKDNLNGISEKLKSFEEFKGNGVDSEELKVELATQNATIETLSEKIDLLIKYTEQVAKEVNEKDNTITKLIGHNNMVVEQLNSITTYVDMLGDELNENFGNVEKFTNFIAERLNESINFSEYLATKLNEGVSYSELIGEKLNLLATYTDEYLGESLEKVILYTDEIVESQNLLANYTDYLAENTGKGIKYSEHIAEKFSDLAEYVDGNIRESVENVIGYTEYVAENALPQVPQGHLKEKEEDTILEKLEKINSLIENQKINTISANTYQSPALALLSESNRKAFQELPFVEKEKIIGAINESAVFTEADVLNVWNKTLHNAKDVRPHVTNMPEEFKPIWESLTTPQKNAIDQNARFADLSSPYKVRMFWLNQGLIANKNQFSPVQEHLNKTRLGQAQMIAESAKIDPLTRRLGYGSEDIAKFAASLPKKK